MSGFLLPEKILILKFKIGSTCKALTPKSYVTQKHFKKSFLPRTGHVFTGGLCQKRGSAATHWQP